VLSDVLSGQSFIQSLQEIKRGESLGAKRSVAELALRTGITVLEGYLVALVCAGAFLMCVGGAVLGTAAGAALLSGTDYAFGHRIGFRENITDASLAALAGAACGMAFLAPCGKAFGIRWVPPGLELSENSRKVAMIWAAKWSLDRLEG
jgi:hypothetical protein